MNSKLSILEALATKKIYFDGAFGTMLQSRGLKSGVAPELCNLSNPQDVINVHREYLEAGCNIIKTNTFGINSLKYDNYIELIKAAINCAKEATEGFLDSYIAFDIGPTGKLLEPYGDISFEKAVEIYSESVKIAVACGIDLILIETMNDSYETKAAVIAAKENSDLPVFVTNVYDASGKLMTGADASAMITMLEGLRVDAIGMNCSLGPDKMLPVADDFCKYSSLPLIANPNAGLPEVVNGETVFAMDEQEFSDYAVLLAEKGFSILGGCCGTTPNYIKRVIEKTKHIEFKPAAKKNFTVVSSYTHSVVIENSPVLIGERINPTGKPKFKEALKTDNINYILNEGIKQADKGVHILDVNVGLPEINECEMLVKCIKQLQSVTDLPIQIDSSDVVALEQAMRIYNGKPLVNSVNGKAESMNSVFPLVKKYGGVVIALTLDESGIPDFAEDRIKIAKKIIEKAAEYGIDKKDIIVDPLAMAVSSKQDSAINTLKAIEMLSKLGVKTSLGVSNISFGLPQRDIINSNFFTSALEKGLNCAIMNPFSELMMKSYFAFRSLHGLDLACSDYINFASGNLSENIDDKSEKELTLFDCIIKGLASDSKSKAKELIKSTKALEIINKQIIPALNIVGADFETGKAFLPQLLMSADAASAAFSEVKKMLPPAKSSGKKVILATVYGDVHDIGKNIVKVLLESYGFDIIDLGKDVPPEMILESAKKSGCKLVGLSALMTTTVPAMEKTIELLHNFSCSINVIVGGAVLNKEYSKMINADYYAPDAMDTVHFAEKFYE